MKQYDEKWLRELCKDSYSYAEVLRKAGRKQGGGAQKTLKEKIALWNIDVSHFTGQDWHNSPNQPKQETKIGSREKYNIEQILIKNSPITQKVLRGYIERHQILDYRCQICGCNGEWQNGKIALEIDHIDGDNSNNEISNLRYLCPNCHALTDTYRGKNKALKNKCVETIHQPPKSE